MYYPSLKRGFIVSHLQDKSVARAPQGLGGAFTYPDKLADETIETYLRPFTASPLRKEQFHQYAIALGRNDLLAIQDRLRTFTSPVRIVWGDSDQIFTKEWSEKLSATFPNSRGIKHVELAKLFFPEELPDPIDLEARHLATGSSRLTRTLAHSLGTDRPACAQLRLSESSASAREDSSRNSH
jgi:haloalkane dehalogenase